MSFCAAQGLPRPRDISQGAPRPPVAITQQRERLDQDAGEPRTVGKHSPLALSRWRDVRALGMTYVIVKFVERCSARNVDQTEGGAQASA